jgi:hypothetical protein
MERVLTEALLWQDQWVVLRYQRRPEQRAVEVPYMHNCSSVFLKKSMCDQLNIEADAMVRPGLMRVG